ncbi:hypothetical protein CHU98_g179 [Xylaria longipes]|nr:hypothetical protein CHU98_g179 [Xylaria longipes]
MGFQSVLYADSVPDAEDTPSDVRPGLKGSLALSGKATLLIVSFISIAFLRDPFEDGSSRSETWRGPNSAVSIGAYRVGFIKWLSIMRDYKTIKVHNFCPSSGSDYLHFNGLEAARLIVLES